MVDAAHTHDLKQSAAAQQTDTWNQGQLAHLIPAASHERFLIKASFKAQTKGMKHENEN
jgi:hypothetical protein